MKQLKMKKKVKCWIPGTLLGSLGTISLVNMLTSKGLIRSSDGVIQASEKRVRLGQGF